MVPVRLDPRREVVQSQDTGFLGNVRYRKVRSMDDVGMQTARLAAQSPQPPAPLGCAARSPAPLQVGRRRRRHLERPVRSEKKLILTKTPGQSQAQLPRVP